MVSGTCHPSAAKPGSSTPGELAGRYQASVTFHDNTVTVLVSQPADASSAEREAYNSAHRQCLGHLISHSPSHFDVQISGRTSAPVVEVVVQRSLAAKLQLLQDIASSTASDCSADGSVHTTDMMMPCSIWGFISLLLLAEGGVTAQQWFGNCPCSQCLQGSTDCDPSLPAQTLEVRS